MSLARPIPILGGGSGSSTFLDLSDTPDSFLGQALKTLVVGRDEAGVKFVEGPYANIKDYGAAGVVTTTTLNGALTSGSGLAVLTDASSFEAGQGMAIPGAGVAGAELVVELLSVDLDTNTVTFMPSTSTTVSSGTTVHHDDTVAVKTAIATNKNVWAPLGHYNVLGGGQTTFRITTVAQCVMGSGVDFRTLTNGTIFWSRSTTQDVFLMKGENSRLTNLTVAQESTINSTAGAGVVLGEMDMSGNAGNATYHARVENVGIRNLYDGFRTEYATGCWIDQVYVNSPRRYGFHFNSPAPTGGNWYSRLQAHLRGDAPWKASVVAGFYLENLDTTKFNHIVVTGFKALINYNANNDIPGYTWSGGSPGCFQHIWTNVNEEIPYDSAAYMLKIEGIYQIERIKFNAIEIGGAAYIGGSQTLDVGIDGFTAPLFGGTVGIEVHAKGTSIANGDLLAIGGSNDTGMKICSDAEGTHIVNVTPRGFLKGLVMEAGAIKTIISDSDFTYCTTPAVLGSNTSDEMNIRNNSRFKNNIGLDDYGPSVSYTPGWIGQVAFVSGKWYDADGTSSTANWKQRDGGGGNLDGGWFQDPTSSATTIDGGTFA